MENLKYWVAFSKITYTHSNFVKKLWENFGCIKQAWNAPTSELVSIAGMRSKTIEGFLEKRKNIDPDRLLDKVLDDDVKVITLEDKNYPFLLKQIDNMPFILYMKGSLEFCNLEKTLAVVGSRKCSNEISSVLGGLIAQLQGTDITIVSGLALGVDSIAHQQALKNNLKTIAVLGSGFDELYPKQNKKLFEDIIKANGAVLSEYYPDTRPDKKTFPLRNRIVSGLSKGCLVAEAGDRSGALITARLALEHNRELMCIPGALYNPNTYGTHKLLKEGAGLVTCATDILDYLSLESKMVIRNQLQISFSPSIETKTFSNTPKPKDNKEKEQPVENKNIELLDNERKVYEIIKLEPKQFDEIIKESNFSAGELMCLLTTMELKGIINQLPGQKFVSAI
ncbi:MAG: DNA-processing protein DprA [bacterium]